MNEKIEDINDDFLIERIDYVNKKHNQYFSGCPGIYIWIGTDVYKELDKLTGKEAAKKYIEIFNILHKKLLECRDSGFIVNKPCYTFGETWELTDEGREKLTLKN